MYNINLRKEVFGATMLNLINGKRFYITAEELNKLQDYNIFPEDIAKYMPRKVKIKTTSYKRYNNFFSFADIVFIELTRGCNLKCKHCLNASGVPEKKQLSYDDYYNLIRQLSESGIQEIRFTGGEPLIFEGVYKLIKFASDLGVFVSLGTNGTLITKEVAQKLKENGVKRVVISLDGTKQAHDEIRGKGNYDKTISAIRFLKEEGISIKVNSVIMRSNMDDVINLAKQLHKEKTPIFIRRFIASGRGANLKSNMLTKNDYKYVNDSLKEELESGVYVRGHYIRLTDDGKNNRINLPFNLRNGCKAGQRAFVIAPNGDIHFCGFLAAQSFPPISNLNNVKDWVKLWEEIQLNNKLDVLEKNLERYNSIPNIQTTNCLAYVQNFLNEENK